MTSVLKFGLKQNEIEALKKIFSKYTHVKNVFIYGSRAMGNFRVGSDIDLVIKDPKLSTTELLKIETEIDDLLLPYKVDLSLYEHITNSNLIEHINRLGQPFDSQ
jgi:predicted nucleotidyltransferase